MLLSKTKLTRSSRVVLGLVLAMLLCWTAVAQLPTTSHHRTLVEPQPDNLLTANRASAPPLTNYQQLPLSFEVNQGQSDERVKFISRGNGYRLFLTANQAILSLKPAQHQQSETNLRMELIGANTNPEISGINELPGRSNYIIGNDPARWQTDLPHYASVRYQDIYPGIDLIYYGNQRQLEYDLVVAANVDPEIIALNFTGADRISLNSSGDLVLQVGTSQIEQHKPIIYQQIKGQRVEVAGNYLIKAADQIGFQLGQYDRSEPLIIDPVVSYSTYLGGSNTDSGQGIAVDASGNIYVTGFTLSNDFPTANALQNHCNNSCASAADDIFITKINPQGTQLLYSTYLGGTMDRVGANSIDEGNAIAVDAAGNAYITGRTNAYDFPYSAGAARINTGGLTDAFVVKLTVNGGLSYSTYLGGEDNDFGYGIAVDANGNAWVTGQTNSLQFPTTANAAQPHKASNFADAFIAKINATGTAILYSSYLGGARQEEGDGIAVDAAGNAYLTGWTESVDFPVTAGAPLTFSIPAATVSATAFVSKYDANGALVYATYLGGTKSEQAHAIAVDEQGNAYVTGQTSSTDFITTPGAFQRALAGINATNSFVTKLNASGTAFIYSTYIGGNFTDQANGIAVDAAGNAYIVGETTSTTYPITAGTAPTSSANYDAFVTKLNADGSALIYSIYLRGATGDDRGRAIAVDTAGNAYVTGVTFSSDYPSVAAFLTGHTSNGTSDGFVTKISSSAGSLQFSATSYHVTENRGSVMITVNRTANADGTVTVDYATADGTAISSTNYTGLSGTLKFLPGESSKSFIVPIINNSQADCGKSFNLTLSNPTGGATLGTQSTAVVSIDDDDLP